MADAVEFQPEWASAPGDTISDILHERKLSLRDFATQMGLALDRANELLTGRVTITPETAQLLEGVLGGSSGFWLARELQYREDLIRLESKREIHKDKDWLREIPLSDMVRFGWVKPFTNVGDQLSECLRFFSVSNVSEWREKYQTLLDVAAFRISRAVMIQPGAVVAWLRQGERQASSIIWKPWSAVSLRRALEQIRPLTWRKDPQLFLPELVNRCAECGVAIAIVRTPAGCPASGATWFVSSERALLLLSFRYRSDDHFWFTFFHEAGHLLLHSNKALFLEGAEMDSTHEEEEADHFASNVLIPKDFMEALLHINPNSRDVIRFATRVGVAPGVVVGQLQHYGRIKYTQLNFLKRRFMGQK